MWQLRARIIQLRMPSPIRPSWSSSEVLGEGMWDSGGCDASYPLTPVSPFASLREEMPLGSVAVSSRGSGVSPLPLRRSLWSDSRGFCGHQRRQRAAHSLSDRSSSATPLPLGLRATLSSCSWCCLYLREDRREEGKDCPAGRPCLRLSITQTPWAWVKPGQKMQGMRA